MSTASFFSLPAELRLEIYEYVLPPATRSNLAHLCRSPGRINHDGPVSRGCHLKLFWICRQIRREALETAFGNKTFVLEASLYSGWLHDGTEQYVTGCGGLRSIVEAQIPSTWLRQIVKLAFFTILDLRKPRPMGDLLVLQQMTALREVSVVFTTSPRFPALPNIDAALWPLKAIFQCVPADCQVRIGLSRIERKVFLRELGASLKYCLKDEVAVSVHRLIEASLSQLYVKPGTLSGSLNDHGQCRKNTENPVCIWAQKCVNSCLLNSTCVVGDTEEGEVKEAAVPSVKEVYTKDEPAPELDEHGSSGCWWWCW